MYNVSIENYRGERLNLSNQQCYVITRIDGLGPAAANINTTPMAGGDGSSFNSSSVNNRNIVLTIYILRNVEENRLRLYRYFPTKKTVTLYFKGDNRDVYISGYVETCEPDIFSRMESVRISIICEQPFFKNRNSSIYAFSLATKNIEFPISIPESGIEFGTISNTSTIDVFNHGDHETGVEINIEATGSVIAPKIINVSTNEIFQINFEMQSGDAIKITTGRGNKKVILTRGGVETNLMNRITSDSTWFSLEVGDNVFSYTATTGSATMNVNFIMREEFVGI